MTQGLPSKDRSRITDDYLSKVRMVCLWERRDGVRVRDDSGSQSEKAEQYHEAGGDSQLVSLCFAPFLGYDRMSQRSGCWNMLAVPSVQIARDSIHPDQSPWRLSLHTLITLLCTY